MIECRAPLTSEEWEQYFQLRWLILRKPWGQVEGSEKDSIEELCVHFAAFDAGVIVGVARLQFNNDEEAQLRYMAVTESYRNRKIGQLLVKNIERIAIERGMKRIVLNSREIAVGFYQKLGYTVSKQGKTLFGTIKHFVMEKALAPEEIENGY